LKKAKENQKNKLSLRISPDRIFIKKNRVFKSPVFLIKITFSGFIGGF